MRNLWCVVAALLLVGAIASAETVMQREGEITSSDARLDDGRQVDWYRQSLTSGTRYLFSATSDSLDTALLLRFSDGVVFTNDDVSGADAGIVYVATRTEAVEIGVSTSSTGEEGPYVVAVRTMPPARSIQSGQSVTRTLGQGSSVDVGDEKWMFETLLFDGARGDRVTVKLGSTAMDPFLRVQTRDGFSAENDDSGDSTDSELRYTFTRAGQIQIVLRAVNVTEGGEYTLLVEKGSPVPSAEIGRSVNGTLSEETGSAVYLVDGRKGQAVNLSVESDSFEPQLSIVDRLGRAAQGSDMDDDDRPTLHYVYPDDGTISVTVADPEGGTEGAFRLSLQTVAFNAAEYAGAGRALEDDEYVEGYLDLSGVKRYSKYAHCYTFKADAYEVVKIELTSESFDAYLELTGPGEFSDDDDDSLGDLNAQLQTVCSEAGEYTLYVTAATDEATGFYELSFERAGIAEPALEAEGDLELRDQRDITGRYFDYYTVEVEYGASLTIDMLSEDFDAYLFVWSPSGDNITSDDDGGGSTNSRVVIADADEGTWTVYATSNSQGETGSYQIRAVAY